MKQETKTGPKQSEVRVFQKCTNVDCHSVYGIGEMRFHCEACGGNLIYDFEQGVIGEPLARDDLWKNFDLIPLKSPENIISLGVGGSEIIPLEEFTGTLGGAHLYLKMDLDKNPTGTFKDREASIIISRCRELGLDRLVFYSTGNTGRSYTHFAAHLGLSTYFFMPRQCHYKNTDFIKKGRHNYVILVDDHYPKISPFVKKFARVNGLNLIAPLHERNEAYATVAYEQFRELPDCDFFVQTIASGMGPIGFYKGHNNLVKLGLEKRESIPRIICIQSAEMNAMERAYNAGKTELTELDLPRQFPENLYEPTLNSTNPVRNYPQLYECLRENNGIITDVEPQFVSQEGPKISEALKRRGIVLRTDLERSLLIGFAGLLKLAQQNVFAEGQNILMMAVGRGRDNSHRLIPADAVIDPETQDPQELMKRLNGG
jgi:threonine synthase